MFEFNSPFILLTVHFLSGLLFVYLSDIDLLCQSLTIKKLVTQREVY